MKYFSLLFVLFMILSCSKNGTESNASPLILYFTEQEKGIDPYPVRMIVTKNYMRMDEGNSEDNYLLLDRKEKVVFSINHESDSYYQFNAGELPELSATKPEISKKTNDASAMPSFNDIPPLHTSYLAEKETCYDVVSIPGLHPEATNAMKEYLQIMSLQHAKGLERTPKEMQEKCMLVNFIFAPTQHLENGFPIRESDYRGYSRNLSNYENKAVDPGLFKIPEGYEKIEIEV